MYQYQDYLEAYGRIMQFNKNKSEPFHRWYPFVEGYSKEFIQSIIEELDEKPQVCLEPFSGSGTTALELQTMGIKCFSFEVNPLMYLIAKVKLENDYAIDKIQHYFEFIKQERTNSNIAEVKTTFKTLYQKEGLKKWNYNASVAIAIEKIHLAIKLIDDDKYMELFTVALAAILLDVSNLYRNGKCLSYKKNWKDRNITEAEVFDKFDKKVNEELLVDIRNNKIMALVHNKKYLYHEDSRVGIQKTVTDNSIDLVITSPPYLNSRDYTDTYMLELKTLELTHTNEEVRKLREKTLRSHVQIKWKDTASIDNQLLHETLRELERATREQTMWNDSIIDMVRLYFVDMKSIFSVLYKKIRTGGKIYFNVSNSAYYGVMINTLEICASIAENEGFKVIEIRKARYLKTSPQQKNEVDKLLEGVIVIEKGIDQ
ncbi:Methyltransferase domain-containing protein [Anaerosporobacter mobilis DSM 15930]|jgi:16S rRNA G966 N2-methylase RsmD|uniref:site-specific DNA-methyltransferase (cytosine-N(4)-specific) n=1 Tax=Anaerosporobacter mobilis DSM 15930 TaxID=1120996 RepID=A0A1M7N6M9_9FIRM|nr:DNA adenine methylase [Anaerosporobacter mobilis]SHM99216.1 Methyltransferase domain-containing protein [Anaerosporobacter mobilis DSM 15930]